MTLTSFVMSKLAQLRISKILAKGMLLGWLRRVAPPDGEDSQGSKDVGDDPAHNVEPDLPREGNERLKTHPQPEGERED